MIAFIREDLRAICRLKLEPEAVESICLDVMVQGNPGSLFVHAIDHQSFVKCLILSQRLTSVTKLMYCSRRGNLCF